jgi:FAD/FMN-containing dehydrogenase/Fe-S oxidoreductase
MTLSRHVRFASSSAAARLRRAIRGEALFGVFDCAQYATDASIYQIFPLGVVVPRDEEDLRALVDIALEEGLALTPRGAGTALAGQALSEGLIIDFSKYFNQVIAIDAEARRCLVQPGATLAALNAGLRPHGLWFPVEAAASGLATIGGMAGVNASGLRGLRHGGMRDNVAAIDAVLADGREIRFTELPPRLDAESLPEQTGDLIFDLLEIGERHEALIRPVQGAVARVSGGFGLDALLPSPEGQNLARLLVGSEGTLALSKSLELKLAPLPGARALGVCPFPSLASALTAVPHMAALEPSAIELVDRRLLDLASLGSEMAPAIKRLLRGDPEALLFIEFDNENQVENTRRLSDLNRVMTELGHGRGYVVTEAVGSGAQQALWDARQFGFERLSSMRGRERAVAAAIGQFAAPLERLGAFAAEAGAVLSRHGVNAVWQGHVGAGLLHMRPAVELKRVADMETLRAVAGDLAAAAASAGAQYAGGEGLGLARSEFLERAHDGGVIEMLAEIKALFDPEHRLNPGKIITPAPMDAPSMLRMRLDGNREQEDENAPPAPGAASLLELASRCDGLGLCREREDGVMCPSFRVTGAERDSPRGRANSFRLALSGELGPVEEALASEEMYETMKLCVSCKACKTECPYGIDVGAMKIVAQSAHAARHGLSRFDQTWAHLPDYLHRARKWRRLLNLRDAAGVLARLSERFLGLSADRPWPRLGAAPFAGGGPIGPEEGREVLLFADTFNLYFDGAALRAAVDVLSAAGYRAHILTPPAGERAYCCGRTFLEAGLVDEARREASRLIAAAHPFISRGVKLVGLEPSCLLTLRDEAQTLVASAEASDVARNALLFEEFVAAELDGKRFAPPLRPFEAKALLHGHCWQKAFGSMAAVKKTLALAPGLQVEEADAGCCGMAGGFGYRTETLQTSLAMAEQALFPAIRRTEPDTLIVADGFSCRQQINSGAGRTALHTAVVLKLALAGPEEE